MSSTIINNLKNIENLSYLELGIFDNKNFNQIKSNNKLSVDLNGLAMFTGSTDEFFNQLDPNKKFDIIFIDANHDIDFVVRDFNNAVKHATQWVLIHDMIPPSRKYIQSRFCSDSYKLLMFFLQETKFNVYPMNNNMGLTLIKMPADSVNLSKKYLSINYDDFIHFINDKKTYSDEEIINILRK